MPLFNNLIKSFKNYVKQKARQEDPPRYIIDEPGDMLYIPAEKLDLFLSELKTAITTINGMIGQGLLTGDAARVSIRQFTWIDDGRTDSTLRVKGI